MQVRALWQALRAGRGRLRVHRHLFEGDLDHTIAFADRFRGVGDEIHHQLLDLGRIGPYGRKAAAEIGAQRRMLGHRDLEQLDHILDDLGYIDQFNNGTFLSRIDHQLTDDFGAANGYGADSLQLFIRRGAILELSHSELGAGKHAAQKIVKVVSNAAGKPPHAFELLPGDIFFLGVFKIGDIGTGSDIAGEDAAEVVTGHAGVEQPAILSVGPPQTVLHLKAASGVEGHQVGCDAGIHVIRMHAAGPAVAHLLFEGASGEGQPTLVEEGAGLVRAGNPDHGGRGIGETAEARFAFAYRGFGAKALKLRHIGTHARETDGPPAGRVA